MAGRRSVWSDPRIQSLARKFVLAADEVYRLQTGKDRECRWFQAMVQQKRPGGTRQGIYVATAGGRLLASINEALVFPLILSVFGGFIFLALVKSALDGIYAAALYKFATTGDPGEHFDADVLRQAFRPKKKRW